MKRRILPKVFLLTIIALAISTLGFSGNDGKVKKHVRQTSFEAFSQEGNQTNAFLAAIRNNQHSGVIAPEDIKRAINQMKKLKSQKRAFDLGFQELGPDNFGGRTRAILFDNRDASGHTIYTGAVTGGLWRSTNYGINWEPLNAGEHNINVTCITQAPNGVFYVGTGENFDSYKMSGTQSLGYSSGFVGSGIYKSTDGDNFQQLASTVPSFNNADADWAFINKIAAADENRVYAATNAGLKVSTDGGETWVTATDADGNELSANSFDVDLGKDGTVYAVVDNLLYVSAGAADQFKLLSTGDSTSLPNSNISRMEIATAPSDENIVYASLSDQFGNMKGVYRSDNKGETWSLILPGTESIVIFDGQGVFDQVLTVFPDNPDKVLLGGINLWVGNKPEVPGLYNWEKKSLGIGGDLYPLYVHINHHVYTFSPNGKDVFIGTDGGIFKGTPDGSDYTFQALNRGYITTQFYSVAACGDEHYVLGGAQDNGVILIKGTGNTQKEGHDIWTQDMGFLSGQHGGGVAISTINPKVIVYGSTKGKVRRSEDAGENISTQFLGGIGNPQAFKTPVALWECFNNENSRDSVNYHAKTEIPGGTDIIVKSNNSKYPFHYTTPSNVTLHPGDSLMIKDPVSSRLFLATAGHIYMTKELHNFGKTPEWFLIADASTGYQGIPYTIAYSSDANHLFVGNYNGKLYRISNLALAYNYDLADVRSPNCIVAVDKIPVYIPGTNEEISQCITSIAVDPKNPQNVLLTLGNYGNDFYVLYTQNGLDKEPEFASRQGNLPQMPVYSSMIDMTNPGMAIIGTEMGIMVTSDITAQSPNWIPEGSALGNAIVFEFYQQRIGKEGISDGTNDFPAILNFGDIYAATYGKGLIHSLALRQPVGISENSISIKDNALTVFPNPVSDFATLKFNAGSTGYMNITVSDMNGKVVYIQRVKVNSGVNTINLNTKGLSRGIYIVKGIMNNNSYQQKFIVK